MNRLAATICVLTCFLTSNLPAQETPTDLTQLKDQTVDILLTKDKFIVGAKVTEVLEGKAPKSIRGLKVLTTSSKNPKNVSVSRIVEIYIKDWPVDVVYDKKTKCLIFSQDKRTKRLSERKKIAERLRARDARIWEPITKKDHEAFLQQQMEFVKKVQSSFENLRLVETNFFLFLTDLNDRDLNSYIHYLDEMYLELCGAFGLPVEKNVWCGKCVVVAFERENSYLRFEVEIMKNNGAQGTQGVCHQFPDGKVVFAGYQGERDFAHVLVHETAHGFVHRYFSTARAPSWLNEGMSDWLAGKIVKSDRNFKDQVISARIIKQNGTVGNLLSIERLTGSQYGAANAMVEILLEMDRGGQFRNFFINIKQGMAADESLKDNFGISYRDLEVIYMQRLQNLK